MSYAYQPMEDLIESCDANRNPLVQASKSLTKNYSATNHKDGELSDMKTGSTSDCIGLLEIGSGGCGAWGNRAQLCG